MDKIDKNLINQFNECTVDEICAFIIMELDELKVDFEEILKFHGRHKRMPLRLTRSTRVKTIGIEKLILLFRKKSVEDKKEVKVKKTQAKLSRQKSLISDLEVQQHVSPRYNEIVNFNGPGAEKDTMLVKSQ